MARSNNRLFPLSLSLSIKLSVKELRAKKNRAARGKRKHITRINLYIYFFSISDYSDSRS